MEKVWVKFESLPAEAKREVLDFVEFLLTRHRGSKAQKKTKNRRLLDESFVGMWKNRKDLQDSTEWVRKVRGEEWNN